MNDVGEEYQIYVGDLTNKVLKEKAKIENMPVEAYISYALFHLLVLECDKRKGDKK